MGVEWEWGGWRQTQRVFRETLCSVNFCFVSEWESVMLLAGEWDGDIWFWKGHSGCQEPRPGAQGGIWGSGTSRLWAWRLQEAMGLETRDNIHSERGSELVVSQRAGRGCLWITYLGMKGRAGLGAGDTERTDLPVSHSSENIPKKARTLI